MAIIQRAADSGTAAVLAALGVVADRIAELAVSAPDPEVRVRATPAWSLTDVFGHVALEPSRYQDLVVGRGAWPADVADLPAFNAARIRMLPSRDLAELAVMLRADTARLISTMAGLAGDAPMMFIDGEQLVRADRALGLLLGEFVVHGRDIAEAIGARWPIGPAHIRMIMDSQTLVMPGWVNPATAAGLTATFEVRVRGLSRYVYAFRDGGLTVNPPAPDSVDVHISVAPRTALLTSYGRINTWLPVLTGRMIAWGRRPWLAARLPNLFHPA